jgi:hypothetical protein
MVTLFKKGEVSKTFCLAFCLPRGEGMKGAVPLDYYFPFWLFLAALSLIPGHSLGISLQL